MYHSHRRQLQHLHISAGNRCFGQSGQAYSARQTCTVLMNGKKVRMLRESWELLVAALVVLAFFLNLTGVNHFPMRHGTSHGDFTSQHAGFENQAVTPVEYSTTPHAGWAIPGHGGIYDTIPAHRPGFKPTVVPDFANRCAIQRLALQFSRSRWLDGCNILISNSYAFTSEYINDSALSSGGKPNFSRLS